MARNRRKKALYEVISKSWPKSDHGKTLEQSHLEKSDKNRTIAEDSTTQMPEKLTKWSKRPRIVQFNADKIEVSMPYQLAVALLLGVILLVLVAFRLGQKTKSKQGGITAPDVKKATESGEGSSEAMNLSAEKVAQPTAESPKGNNRIVIQTYQLRTHLEPVKQYFALFGIETEIRKIDNWYYLVTTEKYQSTERAGTDGYLAKQRIIELGAEYKAPQGYESFAPNFFKDAFGQRFDD